jgi:hypothetical protein
MLLQRDLIRDPARPVLPANAASAPDATSERLKVELAAGTAASRRVPLRGVEAKSNTALRAADFA